ncbi:MAG: preprotein translocase subunit SecE [Schleiferiaceae bacterium]|jgi:preprotein translocase subunit SecE|nr:preprotein translocase subunit SecE [Schleiferiaceae bacterium]
MENIKSYLKDTYVEFTEKTTWPTFSDLQKSTVLVAVSTIIFALIIFLMDKGLSLVLENVYKLFA